MDKMENKNENSLNLTVYKKILNGESSRFPNKYWDKINAKDNLIECFRYYIEDILNLDINEDSSNIIKRKYINESHLNNGVEKIYGKNYRDFFKDCYSFYIKKDKENIDNNKDIYSLEFYKDILSGKIKKFPKGYWANEKAKDSLKLFTRYYLEDVKNIDINSIDTPLNKYFPKECMLQRGIQIYYDRSFYKLIKDCYPYIKLDKKTASNYIKNNLNKDSLELYKDILNKDIKIPKEYWDNKSKEEGIKCLEYLIETHLNLKDINEIKEITKKDIRKGKLNSMIKVLFEGDTLKALNKLYPEIEFLNFNQNIVIAKDLDGMEVLDIYKLILNKKIKKFPSSIYSKKGLKQDLCICIDYLLKEHLKLTDDEIKKDLSKDLFKKYGLDKLIKKCFNNNMSKAIIKTYPKKFKKIELFRYYEKEDWDKELAIQVVRFFIKKELRFKEKDILDKVSKDLFVDNGLGQMLSICFDGNPYLAIEKSFPNEFRTWQFVKYNSSYWTLDKSIEAVRWLVETKMKFSQEDVKTKLTYSIFLKYNLRIMLRKCFNNSVFEAINATYPNIYKESDFNSNLRCKLLYNSI